MCFWDFPNIKQKKSAFWCSFWDTVYISLQNSFLHLVDTGCESAHCFNNIAVLNYFFILGLTRDLSH